MKNNISFGAYRENQIEEYENLETGELMYKHEKHMDIIKIIESMYTHIESNPIYSHEKLIDTAIIINKYIESNELPTRMRDHIFTEGVHVCRRLNELYDFMDRKSFKKMLLRVFQGRSYTKKQMLRRLCRYSPENFEYLEEMSNDIVMEEYKGVPVFILNENDFRILGSIIEKSQIIIQTTMNGFLYNNTIFIKSPDNKNKIEDRTQKMKQTIEHEREHFFQKSFKKEPLRNELLSQAASGEDNTITKLYMFLSNYSQDFIKIETKFSLTQEKQSQFKLSDIVSNPGKKDVYISGEKKDGTLLSEDEISTLKKFHKNAFSMSSKWVILNHFLPFLKEIGLTKRRLITIFTLYPSSERGELTEYYLQIAVQIKKRSIHLNKKTDHHTTKPYTL